MLKSKRELFITLIGLVGMVLTGVFSNWEEISADTITVEYENYIPTGKFETELRYYFDITGLRESLEELQNLSIEQLKYSIKATMTEEDYADISKEIDDIFNVAKEEAITFEEMIEAYLPVYENNYTIKELQHLNRFFSSEIMRNFIKKDSLVLQQSIQINNKLIQEFLNRYIGRLKSESINIDGIQSSIEMLEAWQKSIK